MQPDLLDLLGKASFFDGFAEDDRARLFRQMQTITFTNGELIFGRGDEGKALYVLVDGKVRLSIVSSDGRELSFLHAAAGTIFGEIAALDGGLRTADATALAPTKALVLSRKALLAEIATRPPVAEAVIRFLCGRLRATNDTLEAVALHAVEVRLARFLLARARAEAGAGGPLRRGRVSLSLDMSQTDIGLMIGASRPKVNGAFSLLEAEGVVRRDGKVLQCDVTRLAAYAGEEDFD